MFRPLSLAALLCLASAQQSSSRPSVTPAGTVPVITPASTLSESLRACCWLWAGFTGVKFNSWYPDLVTIYTATKVTTFLVSGQHTLAVNSTIEYPPTDKSFSGYGFYNPWNYRTMTSITLPGVPTDLVSFTEDPYYAGTSIIPAGQIYVTMDHQESRINSPTPWMLWDQIVVSVDGIRGADNEFTPSYKTKCGVETTVEYISYSQPASAWVYYNTAQNLPEPTDVRGLDIGEFCDACDYPSVRDWIVALPEVAPVTDVLHSMPPEIVAGSYSNKTKLSESPWLTDCYTFGGEGQPTVHIQVTLLTRDVSHTITVEALATPQPVPSQTAVPAVTFPQTTSASSVAPQQSATSLAPKSVTPESTSYADVVIASAAVVQVESRVTVEAGLSTAVDGAGMAIDQQTTSLASQASGSAINLDDTTTQALSPRPQQTIAVGNTVVTIAASATGVVIEGVTLQSDQSTVVNGQTIAVAGTNIVIAGGGTTTTQGIGPAIWTGLGGGSSSSRCPYTGSAPAGTEIYAAMVSGVLCLLALWF